MNLLYLYILYLIIIICYAGPIEDISAMPDLSLFYQQLIRQPDLQGLLQDAYQSSQPNNIGEFTIFAPNNDAMTRINRRNEDPNFLWKYHIVPGRYDDQRIFNMAQEKFSQVHPSQMTNVRAQNNLPTMALPFQRPTINNAFILQSRLMSRGIINVIDNILWPPERRDQIQYKTAYDALEDAQFSRLRLLADRSDYFRSELRSMHHQTFFLPNDQAFANLGANAQFLFEQSLMNNTNDINDFIKSHIIPLVLYPTVMDGSKQLSTLNLGKWLTFRKLVQSDQTFQIDVISTRQVARISSSRTEDIRFYGNGVVYPISIFLSGITRSAADELARSYQYFMALIQQSGDTELVNLLQGNTAGLGNTGPNIFNPENLLKITVLIPQQVSVLQLGNSQDLSMNLRRHILRLPVYTDQLSPMSNPFIPPGFPIPPLQRSAPSSNKKLPQRHRRRRRQLPIASNTNFQQQQQQQNFPMQQQQNLPIQSQQMLPSQQQQNFPMQQQQQQNLPIQQQQQTFPRQQQQQNIPIQQQQMLPTQQQQTFPRQQQQPNLPIPQQQMLPTQQQQNVPMQQQQQNLPIPQQQMLPTQQQQNFPMPQQQQNLPIQQQQQNPPIQQQQMLPTQQQQIFPRQQQLQNLPIQQQQMLPTQQQQQQQQQLLPTQKEQTLPKQQMFPNQQFLPDQQPPMLPPQQFFPTQQQQQQPILPPQQFFPTQQQQQQQQPILPPQQFFPTQQQQQQQQQQPILPNQQLLPTQQLNPTLNPNYYQMPPYPASTIFQDGQIYPTMDPQFSIQAQVSSGPNGNVVTLIGRPDNSLPFTATLLNTESNIPIKNGVMHVIRGILSGTIIPLDTVLSTMQGASSFTQLLQQTGVLEQLKQSGRPYTLFIPTNTALQTIGVTTNINQIRQFVLRHVCADVLLDPMANTLRRSGGYYSRSQMPQAQQQPQQQQQQPQQQQRRNRRKRQNWADIWRNGSIPVGGPPVKAPDLGPGYFQPQEQVYGGYPAAPSPYGSYNQLYNPSYVMGGYANPNSQYYPYHGGGYGSPESPESLNYQTHGVPAGQSMSDTVWNQTFGAIYNPQLNVVPMIGTSGVDLSYYTGTGGFYSGSAYVPVPQSCMAMTGERIIIQPLAGTQLGGVNEAMNYQNFMVTCCGDQSVNAMVQSFNIYPPSFAVYLIGRSLLSYGQTINNMFGHTNKIIPCQSIVFILITLLIIIKHL
ncbi:unnamed protein product [Rotaria sordida]|uniref:FAS1 domain-containing protein n=1 Tax=Rotaria sordida TaxID=392033 RepID=A0A814QNF8_9BILA|nr:unnamed protein product [Rotaria sordida]